MSAISACTPMHNVSANMEVAVRVDLLNAICAEQKDKKTNVGFKQLFQHLLLKQDREYWREYVVFMLLEIRSMQPYATKY